MSSKQLVSHSLQFSQILCGPTHFMEFSLKTVTEEIQSSAPDVYQLFVQLGNTDRNTTACEVPAEQKKALNILP